MIKVPSDSPITRSINTSLPGTDTLCKNIIVHFSLFSHIYIYMFKHDGTTDQKRQ